MEGSTESVYLNVTYGPLWSPNISFLLDAGLDDENGVAARIENRGDWQTGNV